MESDDVFTLLLQESGSEGAGVRGGPDEDAGRGSAAEAAAHRGGGPAVEGETGTLRLLRGTERPVSFIALPCISSAQNTLNMQLE